MLRSPNSVVVPARLLACVVVGLFVLIGGPKSDRSAFAQLLPLPTEIDDFFQPGTQPFGLNFPVIAAGGCTGCHAYFSPETAPYDRWHTSMMAQAGRDPLFHACLAIANQDADFAGDLCLRCHNPSAWLDGRSDPPDGSALTGTNDWDGVTCHLCHRMVDPIYEAENPTDDIAILGALTQVPTDPHTGQFVIDPEDRRRGPRNLGGFGLHQWRLSPFHRESKLCSTCHDVSNPVFVRDGDDYILGEIDEPHPTQNKYDEFPIERTYSEWLMSDFAQGPVDVGGRFGGAIPAVSTCQDCHMPKTSGYACNFFTNFRTDLAQHDFNGAATWILDTIMNLDLTLELYDTPAYMDPARVDEAKLRNISMLQRSSDMELSQVDADLNVRIVNQSGHKLPTGYPEGRRMWINVEFQNSAGAVIEERGAYDFAEAWLTTSDTKVYEAKLGLDDYMSTQTGIPAGVSFHFVLNNKFYKDNRIPPRGFTNANFESVQAAPVAYTYEDGQYWDDTAYQIPTLASMAVVRVYYQTASREYIEFLRSENVTNDAGEILYEQWEITGKGRPVLMHEETIVFTEAPFVRSDCNTDGTSDISDAVTILGALFTGGPLGTCLAACDVNDDGGVDISDSIYQLSALFVGGVAPASPYPDCGTDPTLDVLGCHAYPCP